MRLVAAALLLAVCCSVTHAAPALNCKDPQSNYEMKMCADQDLKKADAELKIAYDKAIAHARETDRWSRTRKVSQNKPDDEPLLREAQRAWVSFRDANCKYQYQIYYGGSHAGLAYLLCMADTTKARVKELRQLPGGDEFEQ